MCTTCGCGAGQARIAGEPVPAAGSADAGVAQLATDPPLAAQAHPELPAQIPAAAHVQHGRAATDDGGQHRHYARHGHHHHHHHHDGHDAEPASTTSARLVQIERDILASNDAYAAANRRRFDEQGIFALNLVSSPGSGKTSLLCRTIELLQARLPLAVIEGDQQTSRDAERIRATGVPALQINTGKGCHLDAHMVGHALQRLSPSDDSLLLIENVGNLVCPAAFDLGEAHKVVILSVTEGEDKPLKYPNMFAAASLMLLNKIDLLPHLSFDVELAIAYARQVNPALQVIRLSATTGEGFEDWLAWLDAGCAAAQRSRKTTVDALRRRVAELETLLSSGARC
ncbi:hydrogenase nickel incorporation protein HypB [Accumulibacter sp.]|jgi:hydrogenase nickel incorporation protein HypB|uniref:hydrogenase nickel incorporation protein HypB n=1 Tax=Accumulibacter sp. TaxID=2053492 RepID=UPI001AC542E3|nr:hydrogenase nickel incorporation protein HypB [Accumulibacter sp.]MBN8454060.1 hydrogenase nickel incorporation protein HypB [Accumulibacter sp.]MBO3708678.1 hydrogenase nickel incorporation protein HypB [Candidatus Accumulibacter conexus]